MKKIIAISIGIFLMSFSVGANPLNNEENFINGYGNSFIFVVQNVEFSVYPDGQYDFTYVNNYNGSNVSITAIPPYMNISYNSGYNYDVYVQYDLYGAVIQVEDVPVYYDEYGRIAQAGNVEIFYYNGRITQIGGLYLHYNYYGNYSYSTGYINQYNYYYVYQPWHRYYIRPIYANCILYTHPYRRYYNPVRYSYYEHNYYYLNRGRSNVSYANGRGSFYKPGSRVHYKNGRTTVNTNYRSNGKNTAVSQNGERDVTYTTRRGTTRNNIKKPTTDSDRNITSRVAGNFKANDKKEKKKSNRTRSSSMRNKTVNTSNNSKSAVTNSNREASKKSNDANSNKSVTSQKYGRGRG